MNGVVGVDGPAGRTTGGGELEHVSKAWIVGEALSSTFQHVTCQLAIEGLGDILCTGAGGICEVPLSLFGVLYLELEGLSCHDRSGINAIGRSATVVMRVDVFVCT